MGYHDPSAAFERSDSAIRSQIYPSIHHPDDGLDNSVSDLNSEPASRSPLLFSSFFKYIPPFYQEHHFSLSTLTTLTFIFLSNSSFCCSVGTSPNADSTCGEAVIPIPAQAIRPTPKRRRVRGERFLYELDANKYSC